MLPREKLLWVGSLLLGFGAAAGETAVDSFFANGIFVLPREKLLWPEEGLILEYYAEELPLEDLSRLEADYNGEMVFRVAEDRRGDNQTQK
ncbi:hypothetical protein SARC_04497 [Sphaeroforma arctica JP610]|uniref:Uncharacterized protein n=1 Tax=Sphaeroforma arctica JP610 TaxID=667725 RepID=A0A0L0G2E1_9EUKA|nr:hypothetical protein SARC_04497 [Sphaeroforma arctica JP610]KNC83240.1 hypothetical protein SARC_04497 [Sphaeroforma arctica JP610]|eukprot:XP_014157142.1 hypothetical protein SARC_04497 [Sphaeroforma arctica JP610]